MQTDSYLSHIANKMFDLHDLEKEKAETWESLPDSEKKNCQEFTTWKKLTPDERRSLRKKWKKQIQKRKETKHIVFCFA